MKTILVTGATGFIGCYVIPALLERGCHVIASSVDEQKARQQPWYSQVTYIPFDFADLDPFSDYYSIFGSPDRMIHLAWEGLPNYKADFHISVNLPRHLAFLQNLLMGGLKDITITGTCFEYGMREGELKEDFVVSPTNPYAIAKDRLRIALTELQFSEGFSLKWVRLFYMFGKGQSTNSLLSQLDKALDEGQFVFNMSGGEQVRDYLPVEEVARNIVKIALQEKVTGIINCASGQPVTIRQFVQGYLESTRKSIHLNLGHYPYPDYEPMSFWANTKKLQTIVSEPARGC
ncbi:MAG: NAD(P)-dependent oxidoreductase [Chitinophagaceae bacterium]